MTGHSLGARVNVVGVLTVLGGSLACSETSESTDATAEVQPTAVEADAGKARRGDAQTELALNIRLPPANAQFDYQLGGAYPLPSGVTVVSRDRNDAPAPGAYNLCYVNGFQIQPDEEGLWDDELVLRDTDGDPVIDEDWDETLLDISSASKRERIAEVVIGWIEGCSEAGFDAVEVDNLDTYSRSQGRISKTDAVSFMALLSTAAHQSGLAIAQKNSAELLGLAEEMGTDLAVAEECSAWGECADYIEVYGAQVLMIEYTAADFAKGCQDYGDSHAIVYRDLNLVPAGARGYVYQGC